MNNLDFVVDVTTESRSVSSRGFGTILILDNEHTIPFSKVSNLSSLEKLGVEKDTDLYKMVNSILNETLAPKHVAIIATMGEEDFTKLLQEAVETDNDFFYVIATKRDDAIALAQEVVKYEKMFFTTAKSLEEVKAMKETIEDERSLEKIVMPVHPEDLVAEKLVAHLAATIPGKAFFKFHRLNGVKAIDADEDMLTELKEEGSFTYRKSLGREFTSDGITLSGEYIDVILTKYFIKFRLEENALDVALRKAAEGSKIAYNNDGIAELVSATNQVLLEAQNNDALVEYDIEYLERDEVSKEDRFNRHYAGITATGVLAGAISTGHFSIRLVV